MKKRKNLKRSIFFNEIFKYHQKIVKNDEDKILEETEKSFNKLKIIFQKDGINKMDENILLICIEPFKEKEENLKNELKILSELLKVNGNLDNIYEDILYFSKREFIFETVTSIDVFIESINPNKTSFLINIKEIITTMKAKKDIETIKKCDNKLKELKIYDGKEKENKLMNILFKFKKQPESIEFLLKTSIQDLNNLQEIASSNEINFVNINDILDMGKCIQFFNDIGRLNELKKMKDFEIIEKMNEKVQKSKDIDVYFGRYIDNFGQIKLLDTSVHRSEFLKYKIQALFNGCTFLLSNRVKDPAISKELLFECKYETKVKEGMKKFTLSRGDIIYLRDRTLLAKSITSDYQYFIDSMTDIISISNLLNEIYIKGYPKIIKITIYYQVDIVKEQNKINDIEIKINPKINYYIDEKEGKNLKNIISELKNILSIIKQKQITGYKTMPLIRYLYGRQFYLLYENLDENKNNQIEPLLKYITNDSNKMKVDNFGKRKGGDIIENNIQDWNDYLKKVLEVNNLTLENIYKPSLINQNNLKNNIGIFTYVCEKPEKNLFQIYKFLTGNNPIAQNILLCNKMTSNEEITAFLYRAILCDYNSCFIVAGLELLETEKKTTILDILNNFFQRGNEKINSCLIFLYMSKN